jgi:hypothetical protein
MIINDICRLTMMCSPTYLKEMEDFNLRKAGRKFNFAVLLLTALAVLETSASLESYFVDGLAAANCRVKCIEKKRYSTVERLNYLLPCRYYLT